MIFRVKEFDMGRQLGFAIGLDWKRAKVYRVPWPMGTLRWWYRRSLLRHRRQRYVQPNPPPRYDEIYREGVKWLDEL